MARGKVEKQNVGANFGFEATLWAAADKLRGHMDAADCKRVVVAAPLYERIITNSDHHS